MAFEIDSFEKAVCVLATSHRLLSQYHSGEQKSRLRSFASGRCISSKTWLGRVSNVSNVSELTKLDKKLASTP